ncbi:MAG: DEAD/DEAH box helicase [Candidatus Andersenbacteria bacterium]
MSQHVPTVDGRFTDLAISPKMQERLAYLKFINPTPIQAKAIPIALEGKDVIGIAQTGTGKTLAFVLPMIEHIARTKKQGLIILPTRELAAQVDEVLQKLANAFGLRRTLLIGGAAMGRQIAELRSNPHVIVGTPGRMNDHIQEGRLKLHNVGVVVLDEADRMLDMGFAPQIKKILQHVPRERQTMLFSATMPGGIVSLAQAYMKLPVRVEVAQAGTVSERVNQELFIVSQDQKLQLLDKLLKEYSGTVLVFSRTKHGAKKMCRAIRNMDHSAAEIHSNLSLAQRRRALEGFKAGKYRVLVATDIASRGIDVTNIELVVNFDLPDNLDDYVHRVGRTGRAGKTGHAISFITPSQRSKIRILERMVRDSLKVSPLPELPPHRAALQNQHAADAEASFRERGRRPFRRGGYTPGRRGHSPSRQANRSGGRRQPRVHS